MFIFYLLLFVYLFVYLLLIHFLFILWFYYLKIIHFFFWLLSVGFSLFKASIYINRQYEQCSNYVYFFVFYMLNYIFVKKCNFCHVYIFIFIFIIHNSLVNTIKISIDIVCYFLLFVNIGIQFYLI